MSFEMDHPTPADSLPRNLRWHAIGLTVLAIVFAAFFHISKHLLPLARVNPFAEDPYDAVGSFSFQFVAFIAVVSVIRAFRPYPAGTHLAGQARLVAGGIMAALLAVAITCFTDGIAMARYSQIWIGTSAGLALLTAVGVLLLWATLAGIPLLVMTSVGVKPLGWSLAALVSIFMVSVACWYPDFLRRNVSGAIFTVVVGAAILFIPIKAFTVAFKSVPIGVSFDLLDDLNAMVSRSGIPAWVGRFEFFQKLIQWSSRSKLLRWFNPRLFRWSLVILVGFAIGIALFFREIATDDSPRLSKLLLVATVYVGLETTGVAMGYWLLCEPLLLVRRSPGAHP